MKQHQSYLHVLQSVYNNEARYTESWQYDRYICYEYADWNSSDRFILSSFQLTGHIFSFTFRQIYPQMKTQEPP
jgi:hypothetical protein